MNEYNRFSILAGSPLHIGPRENVSQIPLWLLSGLKLSDHKFEYV